MEKINLENICQKLQVEDRRCKISAFEELQKYCENPKTTTQEILSTFDECYLYLLKCYSDRYESVRDQAAHTVSQFLERLPPNDFHVSNIMSTLYDRMGLEETVEESEEIRLMYVQQLHSLIARYPFGSDAVMESSYDYLRQILKKSVRDAHPAVQHEACACIVTLATSTSNTSKSFQALADTLAKSLYCILGHKHSLVRIAAIRALARLALLIDCHGDALSRLIMEVSPLLMDPMPLVRRECGHMGILLLMELRDRYSYFDRIIPLVLCCLKDESPEVVGDIAPLWVKCGQQYYEENEAELSKQELGDVKPINYPDSVQRPTIGCRALVQRSLRLLTLITRESANWKDNVRLHSMRLLYQFVLHAEAAMTAKFFEIYPDIARACRDYEWNISEEAMIVADLMGRLFAYEDWFEHGFEELSKNAREGYLKCFWAMYNAAPRAILSDVHRISETLAHPDFSQTLNPDFQKYVIKLTEVLLEKCENAEKCDKNSEELLEQTICKNLYVTSIKVFALSQSADPGKALALQEKSDSIFECLSKRLSISVDQLHAKFFCDALQYVRNLDAPLDCLSEPILLLNGLITIAKFRPSYLEELQKKIVIVWQNCTSEAKIKIFSSISVEILNWNETIDLGLKESAQLLKTFLKSVVEEHLSWRAGATAEAMRSLAIATLCAATQGAPKEAQLVLPEFLQYLPCLLEDHSINTRHYALKCISNIGEIPMPDLKTIAYCCLQRLDDPSNDIRVLAATTITKLRPKYENESRAESEQEVWNNFLKKALDVLFIHYDGPDLRLKDIIRGTIMEFACDHPHIVTDCFKRANEQAVSSSFSLEELKREFPNLTLED